MKFSTFFSLLVFALIASMSPALAGTKPLVLMPTGLDNNRSLKELFQHPDQWAQTRSKITTLGCADWVLNKTFSDQELRDSLPLIQQWGLKWQFEVGAVKEWGPTGDKAFEIGQRYWDRFIKNGGKLDSMGMDEPLCCSRFALKKPDDYAVEQTARFIELVRQHYPGTQIGDIEPYPAVSLQDLMTWIDALQAKLKEKGVHGLDFFRVDVDWMNFVLGGKGSYQEVKKLEMFCRSRGIPFSLVYWAADLPGMQKRGLADDSTWYVGIMQMGYDYAAVNGDPDEYVIESWVDGPVHAIPETDPWTFTRSALDFSNRFVK